MTVEFSPGQRIQHRRGPGRFVRDDDQYREDVIIALDEDPDNEIRVSRDKVEAVNE